MTRVARRAGKPGFEADEAMGIDIVFLFCRAAWIAANLPLYHEGTFCETANLAAGTAAPQPNEYICGARVSRAGLKTQH
jgi:hypothetical protein